MIRKGLIFWTAIAASLGLPYSFFSPEFRENASTMVSRAQNMFSSGEAEDTGQGKPSLSIGGEGDGSSDSAEYPVGFAIDSGGAKSFGGPGFQDFGQAFHFQVTPRWVMETWPRVSTAMSDLHLEGYRVPLVTGSGVDDLAGSLTYYFDEEQKVQRITFHGQTGDERRLVSMLTEVYKFQSEPSLGAGLYLVKWNGSPTSVLRVALAPVVVAHQPHARLQVDLEINRPSRIYGLSPEMKEIVDQDKNAGRWGRP
ncbi:MAG: DUF6690 family protein [Pirellulaceae bacterium]